MLRHATLGTSRRISDDLALVLGGGKVGGVCDVDCKGDSACACSVKLKQLMLLQRVQQCTQ